MQGRSEVGLVGACCFFGAMRKMGRDPTALSGMGCTAARNLRGNRPDRLADRPTEWESGEMNAAHLQQSAQPSTADAGQARTGQCGE